MTPGNPGQPNAAALTLRPVATRAEARAFLHLPASLGGAAAGWGVALHYDTARFFNPGFYGYLADHTVARWVAYRAGRPVGRIAAAHRPGAAGGSFGFLALQPDPAVLAAFMSAVAKTPGAMTNVLALAARDPAVSP